MKTKPKTELVDDTPKLIEGEIAVIGKFTDGKVRQLFVSRESIAKMIVNEIYIHGHIRVLEKTLEGIEIQKPTK